MRRHLVALLLVPVFIAGMILAAPPATAGHDISTGATVDPDSAWPEFADDVTIAMDADDFDDTVTYECEFGDGITVDPCEVNVDNDLVATIDVAEDAAPGERTVTVTHDDTESSDCANCFTVNGPTEVDHEGDAEQGVEGLEVDIRGAGFDDENAESATCNFGDGVDVGDEGDGECDIVVLNEGDPEEETIVRATISIDDEAEPGDRDVTVTIFDDATPVPQEVGSGTCQGCFTVMAAQADPTPTPTPEPTPTPTPAPTSDPIDTENVDPEDDDDGDVGGAEESDEDPVLPATGLAGVRAFGVAGLGMLATGLALLGWRRRWTGGGAGTR